MISAVICFLCYNPQMAFGKSTPGTDGNRCDQQEHGWLDSVRDFAVRRIALPVVLMTSINGQINNALAAEHLGTDHGRDHSTYGDIEKPSGMSARQIATYFREHRDEIISNLKKNIKDKRLYKSIIEAINLIANNHEEQHFSISYRPLGELLAQMEGRTKTLIVPPNFDVHNIIHQANLVHEITHLIQENERLTAMDTGHISQERYDNYWMHPGTGIAIPKHEQAAIENELNYINGMTHGKLEKLAAENEDYDAFMKASDRLLAEYDTNVDHRKMVGHRAFYYYNLKEEWPFYIEHLYGCEVGYALFKPSLVEIGVPSAEECDALKIKAGIE